MDEDIIELLKLLPRKVKCKTVKPLFSRSLLPNPSSGIHPVYASHYERRIIINNPMTVKGYKEQCADMIDIIVKFTQEGKFDDIKALMKSETVKTFHISVVKTILLMTEDLPEVQDEVKVLQAVYDEKLAEHQDLVEKNMDLLTRFADELSAQKIGDVRITMLSVDESTHPSLMKSMLLITKGLPELEQERKHVQGFLDRVRATY